MKTLLLAGFALIFLQSCKDIRAKNITGETPVLILPQKLDTVSQNPVHIKWEAMDEATKYRLEIASPSFANISEYVVDSTVTGTDFHISLDSNQFELKLTAINAGYTSMTLGPIKFWVGKHSTVTTGNLQVPLLSPADSTYQNISFDGKFTWSSITGGTGYQFELRKGSEFVGATSVYSLPATNSFEATLPSNLLPLAPGRYFWAVKGYIGSTEQLYSTRTFFIDTVAPNAPVLDLPSLSTLQADTITFTWHFNPTNESFSSPVISTIEIATDLSFNTIYKTFSGTSIYSHDFIMTAGTYYWRVKNVDAAGNIGAISTPKQLTITP